MTWIKKTKCQRKRLEQPAEIQETINYKRKEIMPYDSKRRKRGKSANSNFLEIENIKVESMTYEV